MSTNNLKKINERILGTTEIAITLGLFFIFIVSVLALCSRELGVDLANADGSWMEDYLRDWLVRGVDMTTWQPALASNYFPEMLIYGLLRYGTGSIYLGFMGFRVVKAILYTFMFYKLLLFITGFLRIHRLWIALLLSCGMMLATILISGTQDFWQLYVPGAHGGAFVNILGAIIISLYWLRSPKESQWKTLLLLGVLSTVAVLSDMIYIVWFTIPAMLAMGILVVLDRITKRSFFLFVTCLLTPILLERRITSWITPYKERLPNTLALFEGWARTSNLYLSLLAKGWYHTVVLVSFICLVVITFYMLFHVLRKRRVDGVSDTKETAWIFLLPYGILIAPLNFSAMMAINRPAPQYLMGGDLVLLLLLLFVLATTDQGQRLLASKLFYLTIVFSITMGFAGFLVFSPPNWTILAQKLNPTQEIYPDLVACLDSHADDFENGAGVADYWQVRKINLFSKKDLRVDNVVAGELSPMLIQAISNREMFEDKKRTWIITNTQSHFPVIREADMIGWQGQPDIRFVCAGFPVLVYKSGIKIIIENNKAMNRPTFEAMLANFLIGGVDQFIIHWPENRSTLVGEWDGDNLRSTGQAGYLQFGPYITLPVGSYRIEWHGKVEQGLQGNVGSVDVTIGGGTSVLVGAPVNMPTPGDVTQDVLAVVEFSVDYPIDAVEFRFYVNEKAMVTLSDVVITRLDAPSVK